MSRSEGKIAKRGAGVVAKNDDHRDYEELLPEYLRVAGPVAVVLAGLAVGAIYGPAMAVLVLAGGTMLAAIATFWNSIRSLFGETRLTGEDAYALGAPTAEEEQKRAVLRAIKDIEFEHGVGKISDEDYEYLIAKYRAEAKQLLRVLDDQAQPQREKVERLVTDYLRDRGLLEEQNEDDAPSSEDEDEDDAPSSEDEDEDDARSSEDEDEDEDDAPSSEDEDDEEGTDTPTCSECGTANDPDAVFCKKCGTALGDAEPSDSQEEKEEA